MDIIQILCTDVIMNDIQMPISNVCVLSYQNYLEMVELLF